MIEPTLALQTAIRARLVTDPAVTALVEPDHIRSGSPRPDHVPCVIMADSSTTLHGHDYRAQRAAWVHLDLHTWARGAGQDAAKELSHAVRFALDEPLRIKGGECDHFEVERVVYPRDPDPSLGHGVLSVEALVRWVV